MEFKGLHIPCVTPFDGGGGLSLPSLDRLLDYWLSHGVEGVVVNASTGEGPLMRGEEKSEVLRYVVERVGGRALVTAGTGSPSTEVAVGLTRTAEDLGADAALVASPWFYKPSGEEVAQFFIDVASSTDLPIVLYNVPKFTGYSFTPNVVQRVSEECSNIVALKDSTGSPGYMAEVLSLCGSRVSCLSGSADMVLPGLMLGGRGAVVAIGNVVPGVVSRLIAAFRDGSWTEAAEMQRVASRVNSVLVRGLPQVAAIKEALHQMGFDPGPPRRPLLPLGEEGREKVEALLQSLKPFLT